MFIQSHFSVTNRDHQNALQGVHFSKAHYSDALFVDYGLELPEPIVVAVPKRKAEFLAGRLAARKACSRYLVTPFFGQLAIGSDRAPMWPTGINGSISHCYLPNGDGIAIATCSSSNTLIGVDVEAVFSPTQAMELANMFIDPAEKQIIESMKADFGYCRALTAVFSAKESFFKAAYPDVKCYFDFDAVKVVGIRDRSLLFNLAVNLSDRFQIGDGFVAQIIKHSPTYLITQVWIR